MLNRNTHYMLAIIFSFLFIESYMQIVFAQNNSFDLNLNENEIIKLLTQDLELEKNQTESEKNQTNFLAKLLAEDIGLPTDFILPLITGVTGGGSALVSAYIGHVFALKGKKEDNKMAYANSLRDTRITQYSALFTGITNFIPFEEKIKTRRELEDFKVAIQKWYLLDKGAFLMSSYSTAKYTEFVKYLDTLLNTLGTNGTINNHVELNNYFEQFRLQLLEDVKFMG